MLFSTLITSFVKILASTPIGSIFDGLLVWIDRGVYRLVQTSFTLFMIMCQLNLNVIYDIAVSLVDRLKALIIVFIIFKVGVALIQYMLDPDKAAKGSKKFLINILICAAMLVSYNFVFSVFNELSMMIIGKPDNYKYTTLAQIANVTNDADEGLIFRLFFGTNNNATSFKNVESLGNNIAFNALCATFPDKDKAGLQCTHLIQTISDGSTTSNYNLKKFNNITKKLDVSVDGHPGIALLLGLYMVYSVVKASVEIGTRMFKLMLLQLVAPIAIITVASDEGVKSKTFTEFYKMYISVFLSAFTRITAVLLVTVFVSKIFTQVDTLISDASANGYALWIIIICIVAGYKFAGDIPKMLDKLFTTHLGEDPDKGFGKFLTTVLGAPALGLAGGFAGLGAGIATRSVSGSVIGGLTGAATGFASAFKGNTIADKLKAASEARKNTRDNVVDIATVGAGTWMLGKVMKPFQGGVDATAARYDREIEKYDSLDKDISAYTKLRADAIKDEYVESPVAKANGFKDTITGIKYGSDKSSFIQAALAHNAAYQQIEADIAKAQETGSIIRKDSDGNEKQVDLSTLFAEKQEIVNASNKAASDMWEAKRNAAPETAEAAQARESINRKAKSLGSDKTIDNKDVKSSSEALQKDLAAMADKRRAKRDEFKDSLRYRATHNKKDKS